jgi:hypothetical protein
MRPARIVAILLLAFLFGGGSAEVAVQTKRAIDRARVTAADEGSAGELVAFEILRDGELLARPRVIATPGRATQLVLRDPQDPGLIRLALRLETTREPTGDLRVDYEISVPSEDVVAVGRVSSTHGVEHPLELGERLTAKLLTLPVPSSAFDAYIKAEWAARQGRPT